MSQPKPFLLLVDDDEVDAFVLRKAFSEGPVPVTFLHVLGGDDLTGYLETRPTRNPDLILLDVNMPVLDGFQVLRNLRGGDATRSIPIVMFTTSGLGDDVERVYREGANAYVVKPTSLDGLRKFVACFDEYWFHCAKLPPQGR